MVEPPSDTAVGPHYVSLSGCSSWCMHYGDITILISGNLPRAWLMAALRAILPSS